MTQNDDDGEIRKLVDYSDNEHDVALGKNHQTIDSDSDEDDYTADQNPKAQASNSTAQLSLAPSRQHESVQDSVRNSGAADAGAGKCPEISGRPNRIPGGTGNIQSSALLQTRACGAGSIRPAVFAERAKIHVWDSQL